MDDIRIKDLTSAAGQLNEFDNFEFIVDVPSAEASMKVSGKDVKSVMSPKQHTHALSDVSGGGCILRSFSKSPNTVTTGSRRLSATSGRLRDAALSQQLPRRPVL